MKTRDPWKPVCYLIIAACVALWASQAFGQLPLQPGDTPAPVVQMESNVESSAEHGELTASITGPETARAGSIIAFDVSGSSDEGQELQFRPHVPDDAIRWDSGGEIVYAAIGRPGHYTAVWSVETEHAADVATWEFEVVEGDPPDTDDDPPDSGITRSQVEKWLGAIPAAAREETVTNPTDGSKLTRQQAVGRTFTEVGKVTRKLGSAQATVVMLRTGLEASYGNRAKEWEAFAVPMFAALEGLDDAAEWERALLLVGEVLE